MFLQLTDDRAIVSDSHCYHLCKKRTVTDKDSKKKDTEWHPYKYYGTLEGAIQHVPEQLLKESDANGLVEIKKLLSSVEKTIVTYLNKD